MCAVLCQQVMGPVIWNHCDQNWKLFRELHFCLGKCHLLSCCLVNWYFLLVAVGDWKMTGTAVDEKWTMNKLNGDNWSTWKFQMRHLLLAKGLWGYIDGTEQLPGNANAQTQTEFRRLLWPLTTHNCNLCVNHVLKARCTDNLLSQWKTYTQPESSSWYTVMYVDQYLLS